MKSVDVVVIGGSAAGIPAAITARRYSPEKSILLMRKEAQVLIPCGIPYIFGTVGSPDKNLIPDAVLEKNGIDLEIDTVAAVDPAKRLVRTAGGEEIEYDKLVLATGSLPVVPPIPGVDKENVFAVKKNVAYLQGLLDVLDGAKDLVVVGGGFIGVEFADECRKNRDIRVTIVEMLSHCLGLAYDEEVCAVAEALLSQGGVQIKTDAKVEAFCGNGTVTSVKLKGGEEIEADAVILGIGSRANVDLAQAAGLEIGPTGGIQVDRAMRTSNEHIFACGDCAEKLSFFGGRPTPMKLASIATCEARIAGANLFGNRRENMGTVGVWSTALGDTAFAAAGFTERAAREGGYEIVVGQAEGPNRHPGGMPGMAPLHVKLVFEKSTQVILGGQVRGAASGGELINTISACIQKKMTIDDIATFQTGTHPALTASPIAYQLVNAAELAGKALRAS